MRRLLPRLSSKNVPFNKYLRLAFRICDPNLKILKSMFLKRDALRVPCIKVRVYPHLLDGQLGHMNLTLKILLIYSSSGVEIK